MSFVETVLWGLFVISLFLGVSNLLMGRILRYIRSDIAICKRKKNNKREK